MQDYMYTHWQINNPRLPVCLAFYIPFLSPLFPLFPYLFVDIWS